MSSDTSSEGLGTAPIEAVRNRKTAKLFIVVDDSLEARYKVINPAGETLILPDLLFDEDPLSVMPNDFVAQFTPAQLDVYQKHLAKLAEEAARPKPPPRVEVIQESPTKKRPMAKAVPKASPRSGLGAQWNAPRLSFYRHKIEPLALKQTFRITMEGIGVFEISKEEFLAQFNDVVMSPGYRGEGLFTYREFPEKAKRHLKP